MTSGYLPPKGKSDPDKIALRADTHPGFAGVSRGQRCAGHRLPAQLFKWVPGHDSGMGGAGRVIPVVRRRGDSRRSAGPGRALLPRLHTRCRLRKRRSRGATAFLGRYAGRLDGALAGVRHHRERLEYLV